MIKIIPHNPNLDHYQFAATGLVISNGITYDQWTEVGRQLGSIIEWSQFAVGDWLNYGESRYGEKYAQGLALIPASLKTLQNWVWVARHIPMSVRVPGVSWSHHRAVASLSEERQVWYLDMVDQSEKHFSVSRLEELISEENRGIEAALQAQGIQPAPKPPPPAFPDDQLFELETENYQLKQQVALQQAETDLLKAKPVGGSVEFELLGETRIGWRVGGGESGVFEAPAEVVRVMAVKMGIL